MALGNHEKRHWSKNDCYAPVCSLNDVRLITALACLSRRTLKQGDCKNAFCQSYLPKDERIFVTPPRNCPLSDPDTYWFLKKTLYGLRRSPIHWFRKFKSILNTIGLTASPDNPCFFSGTIIPGKPPIFLSMYVDDFVFFSASDEVERYFQNKLGAACKVDFMGQVSWFLGVHFKWTVTPHKVSAHLSQQAYVESILESFGLTCPLPGLGYAKPPPNPSLPPSQSALLTHLYLQIFPTQSMSRKCRKLFGASNG